MKKTLLITGSTDGIGKIAASMFAKAGHTLHLHGRNPEKLDSVIAEMKTQSNNEHIHGWVADFSDLDAVKKMAQQIKEEVSHLDVLINNAGIFKTSTPQTQEGLDVRFVVNYLAPYLLTNELIPQLQQGNDPQVINLSSAAQAPVSLEALRGKVQLPDMEAYSQSKLAITMWSFYLAQQHPEIAVIALNPGSLLNTNMVREAFGRHWAPADKGAKIIYELATSNKYTGVTGRYFDNDQGGFGQAYTDAYDTSKIAKLRELTVEMVGE